MVGGLCFAAEQNAKGLSVVLTGNHKQHWAEIWLWVPRGEGESDAEVPSTACESRYFHWLGCSDTIFVYAYVLVEETDVLVAHGGAYPEEERAGKIVDDSTIRLTSSDDTLLIILSVPSARDSCERLNIRTKYRELGRIAISHDLVCLRVQRRYAKFDGVQIENETGDATVGIMEAEFRVEIARHRFIFALYL